MGSIYAKDVINVARDNIGYHEQGNNWTIFAKVLDDCDYYAPQKKQNVAWCATFCNYCVLEAAIPEDRDDEEKKWDAQNYMYQPGYNNYSASAALFAGYFKNAGAFYNEPEKGDMIFFKMSDGNIGHVGIVEDISETVITTIEGNASDQVQRKWYDKWDDRIAGFGRPSYDGYSRDEDDETPEPEPDVSSYNCVDVSEWNGEIDWEQAKADGVEYAFIRCGLGRYYLNYSDPDKQADMEEKWKETNGADKYFQINMENALAAGIKVGVYFYSYASNYDDAVDEAEHCIELIEPYRNQISFPVFYDLEETKIIPRIKDVVDGFTNTMNYYNYNVGVYTTVQWFDNYFGPIDCDYFWLAAWGPDDGEPHTKPQWCDVWQYSSRGSVHGIKSDGVDVDILYNTDMKLFINDPGPTPPTPPAPTPTTVIIELDVLSRGSTGGQVNTLKALLNEFGWADLPLDGDFDWDTEQAVNEYKEYYGLEANGVVDKEMWNLLLT